MPITILKAAASLLAAAVIPAGLAGSTHAPGEAGRHVQPVAAAPTIMVAPGSVSYPPPGEFMRDGRPAATPRIRLAIAEPIEIMAYQVGSADYAACVGAGRCEPANESPAAVKDGPVTGVSFIDASAYARWFSEATGETWRLPTDAEWRFAAAERFVGELEGIVDDPANPARRWLTNYVAEAGRKRDLDPQPRIRGAYGANSNGVSDLAGNVWEWTSTCYVRVSLSTAYENPASTVENCGVHVLEGAHRAYMSNFVSDGKSGGCAVGTPPDNLGFRLVRERPGRLKSMLRYLGLV